MIPACCHSNVPCGELSFADLEDWFGFAHCPTKAHIRRALKKHLLQEQIIEEVKQGYKRVRHLRRLAITYLCICVEDGPATVRGLRQCDLCPKSFPRAQQLQIHKWSKHGIISAERQFVFGPICESCGVNFLTTQRMQQHLRSTRLLPDGCFERLRKFRTPVTQPVRFDVPPELKHIQRPPALPTQPLAQFAGPTLFFLRSSRRKNYCIGRRNGLVWVYLWSSPMICGSCLMLPSDRPLSAGQNGQTRNLSNGYSVTSRMSLLCGMTQTIL